MSTIFVIICLVSLLPFVKSVRIPNYANSELAITLEAKKLSHQQQSSTLTHRLLQRFDEVNNKTNYLLQEEPGTGAPLILLQLPGHTEEGEKIIVIPQDDQNQTDIGDDIVEAAAFSVSTEDKSFNVLQLDENNSSAKYFWIFSAVIRTPSANDATSKMIGIKGSIKIIDWRTWNSSDAISKAKLLAAKAMGRSLSMAVTTTESPENKEDDMSEGNLEKLMTKMTTKAVSNEEESEEVTDVLRNHFRMQKQKKLHPGMYGTGDLKQPPFSKDFKSNREIYSHVRWFKNFAVNTKIEPLNIFLGYSYGVCAIKEELMKPEVLARSRSPYDAIEFFAALLREHCIPAIMDIYRKLFKDNLIYLNPDRSIGVKQNSRLLKTKDPKISQMEQLQRMFPLSAYSEVYVSLLNFPTEPLTPLYTPMESRGFILVNAALLVQERLVQLAPHHFKTVINSLLNKYKPITKKMICEFATMSAITASAKKKKRAKKYSCIAMCVLLEFLAEMLKNVARGGAEKYSKIDFHTSFQEKYQKLESGYFKKMEDAKMNKDYRQKCLLKTNLS